MEKTIRGVAGAGIIITVLLAKYVHPGWIWLIFILGLSLFQSAFTGWCPMMVILKKLGIK